MKANRFPGVLGEIAEVAGEEAALKIGAAYGGTRKSIPAAVPRRPFWLTNCVGKDAADAICRHFRQMSAGGRYCGVYLLIPRGNNPNIDRHQEIIELTNRGKTASEIARLLGTSERAVYRHRAKSVGKRPRPKTRRLWLPPRGERKE